MIEIAVLTASFDARPGAEEAAARPRSPATSCSPGTNPVPQRRPRRIGHAAGRFLVIEKWESAAAVQAHLDSPLMTEMAKAAIAVARVEARDRPLRPDLRLRPRVTDAVDRECAYFWRRRSTGTFDAPRSAAPVSLQISRMPSQVMWSASQHRSNAASATSVKPCWSRKSYSWRGRRTSSAEPARPADRVGVPGGALAARRARRRAARRRSRRRAGPWRAAA